ncbi:carbonic anhydrase [Nocardia sp. NPDC127579]|uniref:carbonic anhydrase n=1 Tax=Nocardia sp. NPDC127579 TaxID=3345402 RepID=UPI003643D8B2
MSRPAVCNRRGALTALAMLAIAGCGGSSDGAPHWNYDNEGPEHWADLDTDFATCRAGHAQSPIDLPETAETQPADHIDIDYRPVSAATLINNGHAVQVNVPANSGNRIIVDGASFALTQYHFHLPSEHTVAGSGTAMELHLVHTDHTGRFAVLAVLLRAQDAPTALSAVLANAPAKPGTTRTVGTIDPRALLPDDLAQFRYEGSLTTPPCTEGVAWIVLRQPGAVSTADVERYRTLFPHSNRPTQPRHDRPIILVGN